MVNILKLFFVFFLVHVKNKLTFRYILVFLFFFLYPREDMSTQFKAGHKQPNNFKVVT